MDNLFILWLRDVFCYISIQIPLDVCGYRYKFGSLGKYETEYGCIHFGTISKLNTSTDMYIYIS